MFCSYSEDVEQGQMTDYAHSGGESLQGCAALCAKSESCTCFIHTSHPDPSGGYAPVRKHAVFKEPFSQQNTVI